MKLTLDADGRFRFAADRYSWNLLSARELPPMNLLEIAQLHNIPIAQQCYLVPADFPRVRCAGSSFPVPHMVVPMVTLRPRRQYPCFMPEY